MSFSRAMLVDERYSSSQPVRRTCEVDRLTTS